MGDAHLRSLTRGLKSPVATLAFCGVLSAGEVASCFASRELRVAIPVAVAAEAPPPPPPPPAPTEPPKPPGPELPRGGRTVFPRYRLVGYVGTPGGPSLGRLAGNLASWAHVIEQTAEQYAREREPLVVFELVAVVTTTEPGPDHLNRRRVPDGVVDHYLHAARAAKALLLLNIQPGASDFLTECEHFDKYLREPDVGLALDPEWAMGKNQRPGARFGHVTGEALDAVGEYLSSIVDDENLPEKVLVFHQVNTWVLEDEKAIKQYPGVVMIKSVDGLGSRGTKTKTYDVLMNTAPRGVHAGFKLFFDEDTKEGHRLMTPEQVLSLTPTPEYVMYE